MKTKSIRRLLISAVIVLFAVVTADSAAQAQQFDFCGPPSDEADALVLYFQDMIASTHPGDQALVAELGIGAVHPDSITHFYGVDPISQISCAVIKQEVNEKVEGGPLGGQVWIINVGGIVAAAMVPEQRAGEWAPLFIWSVATGEIIKTLLM